MVDRRASQGAGQDSADAAAAATFLRALTVQLKPLVRHVGMKIRKERFEAIGGGKVREEVLGQGIVLIDEFTEEPDDPDANVHVSGAYGGWRLVFLRDGKLLEQARTGRWTESEACSWRTNVLREVSPDEAASQWEIDPEEILGRIDEAIRQEIEKRMAGVHMLERHKSAMDEALSAVSTDRRSGREGLLKAAEVLERALTEQQDEETKD